MFSNIMHN